MKFERMIQTLIKNRKITLFFVFLVIAAGALAYIGMPKQESPDLTVPYAMITTVFPGATQSDVDTYVTVPINETLRTIDGYEASFAYSTNNLSLVILELRITADKQESFRQLSEALAALQDELPETCGQISVNTNVTDTAGVLICLSSDELTNREVVDQAKRVREKLNAIDGFERFEIVGSLDSVVSVQVNESRMKAAGLSLSDVVSLIEAGNLDLPMGNIQENGETVTVDFSGGYQSIDDVAGIEIGYSAQLNRTIRLEDIADVTYQTAERNTYYAHNGEQAVILAGYFMRDINVLPLKAEIQDALDGLQSELPESLFVSLIVSQPDEISNSLVNFLRNLLIAVGLVILVVLFGMGLRNAVVVSVSLPLSILLSFAAMALLNIKIHQISISALIVSLGMLVDNSIVVSDSIQNYLDEGMDRKEACVLGVKSVAMPILTSTLTTIAAFAPFIFLNSLAGEYIKSLPQIVCIALAASYLSAVFVIPVLGFIFYRPRVKKARRSKGKGFRKLLAASMRHRIAVIFTVIVLAAGSAFLAVQLERIFYPASDKDILYIDIRNNVSNDLDSTAEIVDQIAEALDGEDGVLETISSTGGGLPRFNDRLYVYTQMPNTAQIMMRVDLDQAGAQTNEEYRIDLQKRLDALDLNAKITVKELMYGFPMNEDVKIRIIGDDLDTLLAYEEDVFALLQTTDGLIKESKDNIRYVSGYQMDIDGTQALINGVIPAEAQNEISIAMLGRDASYMMDGEYQDMISVSGAYDTSEAIKTIPIRNADGDYIVAGEFLSLTETQVLSTIPRFDGDYAIAVTADYDQDYNKTETLRNLKEGIEALGLEDVRIVYEGEDENIRENFGQIGVLGLVALAVVFVILLLQFRSFLMPLIIFITIPFSAIGSAVGLYITDLPVSFTALLGIVSLLGIVVNNAIILVDYIGKETAKGMEISGACIAASTRRLRPILLSTITTVIGLIPLAVGHSQLFKPMAVALMSGLLVSTLLTLVVLPVFVSFTGKRKPDSE